MLKLLKYGTVSDNSKQYSSHSYRMPVETAPFVCPPLCHVSTTLKSCTNMSTFHSVDKPFIKKQIPFCLQY